jgi:hypothetical protein
MCLSIIQPRFIALRGSLKCRCACRGTSLQTRRAEPSESIVRSAVRLPVPASGLLSRASSGNVPSHENGCQKTRPTVNNKNPEQARTSPVFFVASDQQCPPQRDLPTVTMNPRSAVGAGTSLARHQGETVTPPHSSGSTSRTVWVSSHR